MKKLDLNEIKRVHNKKNMEQVYFRHCVVMEWSDFVWADTKIRPY